jgi:two-component system LytT family response regulator
MENQIKYLIVEDEAKSREVLLKKIQLCNIADIVCIGLASNATEAVLLSKLTPPDFILLDINLPGKSGFDLLNELEAAGISPEVIFTSAHTETEILLKALKHAPATYLVKPIDIEELEEAINRVITYIKTIKNETTLIGKIKFQSIMGPVYIESAQLLAVKAEAHNSRLFIENGKEILVSQGISEIERVHLHPFSRFFIRADRSTILNLSRIGSIHTKSSECLLIRENDTLSVKISENGLGMVLKAMDKLPHKG